MPWSIKFERILDGTVLVDQSATTRELALRQAFSLIEQGHDVRAIAAPDGTITGAWAIAQAYLAQFRGVAPDPTALRQAPSELPSAAAASGADRSRAANVRVEPR